MKLHFHSRVHLCTPGQVIAAKQHIVCSKFALSAASTIRQDPEVKSASSANDNKGSDADKETIVERIANDGLETWVKPLQYAGGSDSAEKPTEKYTNKFCLYTSPELHQLLPQSSTFCPAWAVKVVKPTKPGDVNKMGVPKKEVIPSLVYKKVQTQKIPQVWGKSDEPLNKLIPWIASDQYLLLELPWT
eukprot:12288355-Karenia_brevis.AAC.1